MKIKILIADDHSLMRVGLNALLGHQKDMAVVGEARDGVGLFVRLGLRRSPR